ncbi:putative mitogen-activated protein kinase kinase kinase STE-STE11 family [Arabidopsis thaliana]|uniref:Protein kinase domain-containing protein n=2 Tax=Arabidopsis thaliana TaxID=3702 RepID=Q1G3Q7_ARATH|nr:unknown protein [Arabidopsis thaliana]
MATKSTDSYSNIKIADRVGVEIIKTPLYMAPIYVNGNEYESATDVWALGCDVVEMFSGKTTWIVKARSHFMLL